MSEDSNSAISLGHLRLSVSRLEDAVAFFEACGARADTRRDKFAVVELGDSTRLQLTQAEDAVTAKAKKGDKAEPKKYVTKQKKDKNEDTPTKASSDKKPVENVASA